MSAVSGIHSDMTKLKVKNDVYMEQTLVHTYKNFVYKIK